MKRGTLPPLNALRAFEAAARYESLTQAARELGVSQAAVSQQVRLLEDHLQQPLFLRHPRRLELTDAGRAYLPILSTALATLREGTQALFGDDAQRPLTVRVAGSFARQWLVPRLPELYRKQPSLRLRLLATTWPSQHTLEGADLEIANGYGNWQGLEVERLTREHWLVVAAPGFPIRHGAADLQTRLPSLPRIAVQGYRETWQQWQQQADIAGTLPEPIMETDTTSLAIEAAKAGLGLLLVRSLLVEQALADGSLVQASPVTLASDGGHYLVREAGRLVRPGEAAFCQWLRQELGG